MPRRKKTRHGATQPETTRLRQQKLLRLHPDTIAALALMGRGGASMSTLVEHAVVLLAETASGNAKAYALAMRGREATQHQGNGTEDKNG